MCLLRARGLRTGSSPTIRVVAMPVQGSRMKPRTSSIAGLVLGAVLAACSGNPLNPEPTSPYRQSLQEYTAALVTCMQEKGYAARLVDKDEGFEVFGAHDRLKLKADQQACTLRIDPQRLQPPPPMTRTQLEAMHRYVTRRRSACGRPAIRYRTRRLSTPTSTLARCSTQMATWCDEAFTLRMRNC
jgi:hypothetical protein